MYTIFDEELVEALLTSDFRDGLDAIALPIDALMTAEPYYWDFVVRQPASGLPQWADVFISIDYDVDGTGLIKIEPYPQTVPPGNLLESENVISCGRGGDAFEKILLEGNANRINFDGSLYAGGTSADEGKRSSTVETPPAPICPMGLTYNAETGLCEDEDAFETSTPTCPVGLGMGFHTTRLCLGGLTRNMASARRFVDLQPSKKASFGLWRGNHQDFILLLQAGGEFQKLGVLGVCCLQLGFQVCVL